MRKMTHYKHDLWAFSLFEHRAFKKVSHLRTYYQKNHQKKITCAILRSTLAPNIDHVLAMIRIKKLAVVVFVVFIVTIVIYALVIKAYLFEWFDIPSGKYSKKGFLDIAFVDVACIQSTVWITGMVLHPFIKVG
jgi:hypothetical protein